MVAEKRRRLPPVPLPTVALEPEQQVGSAVVTTGFPLNAVLLTCHRQTATPRLVVRVERYPGLHRTPQETPFQILERVPKVEIRDRVAECRPALILPDRRARGFGCQRSPRWSLPSRAPAIARSPCSALP